MEKQFIEVTTVHNGIEKKVIINKLQIVKIENKDNGCHIYLSAIIENKSIIVNAKESYSSLRDSLGV
jgi:hypothetical protein